jgi:hypothetical protein
MHNSSDNSSDHGEVKQIDYYKLNLVEKDQLLTVMQAATASLVKQKVKESKNSHDFVQKLLDNADVCDMLIYISRLPVFSKEFAEALKHNLDLLATAKKLKYFTNLSLGQNAILLKNMAAEMKSPLEGMQEQVDKLFAEKELADLRVKDYMKS